MHIDGNAAAIVDDGDAVVVVHDDVDFVAEAGQGFVDGVVHHFPDQMMQALLAGRADVHGRAFAHSLEIAEHLDGSGVVPVARGFAGHRFFLNHNFVRLLTAVEGKAGAERRPSSAKLSTGDFSAANLSFSQTSAEWPDPVARQKAVKLEGLCAPSRPVFRFARRRTRRSLLFFTGPGSTCLLAMAAMRAMSIPTSFRRARTRRWMLSRRTFLARETSLRYVRIIRYFRPRTQAGPAIFYGL